MNNIIINLQIQCHNTLFIPNKSSFKKWIKAVLCKKRNLTAINIITIRIVDEEEIKNLNKIYRKKKSTNKYFIFSI